MRSISTIQEAQQAINDLYNQLDLIQSKNWDIRQRRIVNAHPSVDPYDYVVRKELLQGVASEVKESITEAALDKCTFGVGINSLVVTGTNVCPPYIVARKSGLTAKYTLAVVGTPCTGADIQVQIRKGTNNIFSTSLVIPAGSTAVIEKTGYAISQFAYKDVLFCDVLQCGSDYPGSNLVIVTVFE